MLALKLKSSPYGRATGPSGSSLITFHTQFIEKEILPEGESGMSFLQVVFFSTSKLAFSIFLSGTKESYQQNLPFFDEEKTMASHKATVLVGFSVTVPATGWADRDLNPLKW